jgi:hypothetical protein
MMALLPVLNCKFQISNAKDRRYNRGMSGVAEISNAIERLDVKEQIELLRALPKHLKISPEDLEWARLAERAFEFWDNPEDAIYDKL